MSVNVSSELAAASGQITRTTPGPVFVATTGTYGVAGAAVGTPLTRTFFTYDFSAYTTMFVKTIIFNGYVNSLATSGGGVDTTVGLYIGDVGATLDSTAADYNQGNTGGQLATFTPTNNTGFTISLTYNDYLDARMTFALRPDGFLSGAETYTVGFDASRTSITLVGRLQSAGRYNFGG